MFGLAQRPIRISPVIVGNGQFRVEFKCLVVILNGTLKVSKVGVSRSSVCVGDTVLWIESDSLVKVLYSTIMLA